MIQPILSAAEASSSSVIEAPIIAAQLSLSRVEDVSCLSISFFSSQCEEVPNSVDFYLRQLASTSESNVKSIFQELFIHGGFRVADVYPLNGRIKRRGFKITNFIRPVHQEEIQQQIEILDEMDSEKKWVRCLVIDFKDALGGYNHLDQIVAAEKNFAAFFKGSSPDPKKKEVQSWIYRLIRSNRINFFINEGSLKADLIGKVFTSEQAIFLQKPTKGPELLCQLCEVIMNGFKQGCEVVVNEQRFNPNDYITAINEEVIEGIDSAEIRLPFVPSLVTFYPYHYRRLYSDGSEYFSLLTNIFRTTHSYEKETTIITIE